MRKLILFLSFGLFFINTYSQNIIQGVVKDSDNLNILQNVTVIIKETNTKFLINGNFYIQDLPNGKFLVIIKKDGFETQNIPVTLSGKFINLGTIFMYKESFIEEDDLSTIILSDDELNSETDYSDNISGLLQSSKDTYLKTVAYEWSPAFYRIRGLDSENSKVLINGIEMNKLYNGRPQWNNWGGLNDMTRNQTFSNGLNPSNYTFGGALGSTNINTQASKYRKGAKVSYANSNSSYNHRIMASYSSGVLKNGWSFAIAGGIRKGTEDYFDGTDYNGYSSILSVEKELSRNHSINFTGIFVSTKRGKSAGHTQEVYDLKGTQYNEYWGYQNSKKRNSRIKRISEPILMLNHHWKISEKSNLNTNIAYQFGESGDSRLDYNGGTNPSPTYYQNLPSYWLSKNDIIQTYETQQKFLNNGQLDWEKLYNANITNAEQGKNSSFILYEDVSSDKQFTINTIFDTEINKNILLTGKLNYTKLKSHNFARALDILGGLGYLDINRFGKLDTPQRQNNILNPDRIVKVGDKFKYNFNTYSNVLSAFIQGDFKYNKIDFYSALSFSKTSHQREGVYKNGRHLNNSLGKSDKKDFINFGGKLGATYKISGRHLINFNSGYIMKAPTLKNTFSNIRESNSVVKNLTNEKMLLGDLSYIYRSPKITAKLTGYYAFIKDATNVGFFYQQGAFGEAFVQEITTGINKKHLGIEFGIEGKITSTFKVKGAVNYGKYKYDNNPNVYVTSEDYISEGNTFGINDLGKSHLKNYRLASGPQKSYSFGIEYKDPNFWWFSTTINYLDDSYINISPITRSNAFYKSFDGLPINNIDYKKAKKLLKQEKFNSYFLLNAIGGKSWKIGKKGYKFIGFTAGFTNLLNQQFKTGGFEQSRKPDYTQLLEENKRPKKLFGAKYWYGRGTTYFINVYYRF